MKLNNKINSLKGSILPELILLLVIVGILVMFMFMPSLITIEKLMSDNVTENKPESEKAISTVVNMEQNKKIDNNITPIN